MLFTGELLEMYAKYTEWRGWNWTPLQVQNSDLGGIRSALIAIEGEKAYAALRFEAGVHRVQRIPQTDKSRMHTSTASISVLPEPEEVSVVVPTNSVKIETMRASGPGGQNVNKRSTAVRITHKETGIVVHCMDERFQHLNIQVSP
ncbi:peptidyl-tRNA hydrolase domain protein [Necator americanus]|uniref:Peptidyl-tRNA hydrolase domain protein n=1 Tax=Necator americanus TaxID=51031 RepID=W2TBM5_NECAM|nr:peptidyl-tRNA hydrolase domain protein [Necator americanus]ETN78596.1 peptidyl-tRNA hydrolase domain protein [Necator americanus]